MEHTTEATSKPGGGGATVDAISARLRFHKNRGKLMLERGRAALQTKIRYPGNQKFEIAANFFFQSSLSYRACSRWRQAGDSLCECARVYSLMQHLLETATMYTLAYEYYMKVDKGEGLRALRSAISVYCDLGRFDIAGRLERKVANIHYDDQHWEEAATHFKKAANFLWGEQMLDQGDMCYEKAAKCMLEVQDYNEACSLFEAVAASCTQTNLRRFNARDYLLCAVLCLCAIPIPPKLTRKGNVDISEPVDGQSKYDAVTAKLSDYEDVDYLWRGCHEQRFVRNIVKCRLGWNLNEFADHVYWWNNVRPLDGYSIVLLDVMKVEIKAEIKRREDVRMLEVERAARRAARQQKRQAASALLASAGGAGGDVSDSESGSDLEEELGDALVISEERRAKEAKSAAGKRKGKKDKKSNNNESGEGDGKEQSVDGGDSLHDENKIIGVDSDSDD